MAISEIRACFTFSLDNNGDILMLMEIILIDKKAFQSHQGRCFRGV